MHPARQLTTIVAAFVLAGARVFAAASNDTFTVAAYNVENWNSIERHGQSNQPKPASEKTSVWKILAQVRPDVLGIEEMGQTNDLAELQAGLRERGLDLPHVEWIQSADSNRHVALLSRFPITQRFSRTDYTYTLDGRTHRVQRGFLDVRIQVNDHFTFRALVAHLKSKRQSSEGDQAKMRLEEARLLRGHIGKALKDEPQLRLIAMGDLNDTFDSEAIRTVIGEPPFALLDLMPVDSRGGHDTHFWKARDQFSRIDYLISSPAMHAALVPDSARIADFDGWNDASDHRAVFARFRLGGAGSSGAAAFSDRRVWLIGLNLVAIVAVSVAVAYFARRHHHPQANVARQ